MAKVADGGVDMRAEALIVQKLLRRFHSLTNAGRRDVMELMEEAKKSKDEKERFEIVKTILEILEPERIGKIQPARTRTDDSFLKARSEYIGRKIKEHRERKGWTQIQLAEATGLPQSHISRLESGVHSASNVTLKKVAKALKISCNKLDYEEQD